MKYLTNRQEIAYAMNFDRYPVVRINLETSKDDHYDFYYGDLVKVLTPTKSHPHLYCTGRLYFSEGKFGVMTDATFLHDSFGYSDVMEQLEIAQAPVLRAGDTIVMIEDFPKTKRCKVRMMKVSDRVNPHVYPCAELEDVPDDFDSSLPRWW